MPFEVGRLVPIGLVGPRRLLLQRLLVRRQQAEKSECTPFFRRERRPLVEQGAFKQQVPDERHLDDVGGDGVRESRFHVHISISRCSAGSVMGSGPRKGDFVRESQHERDKLMIAKSSPAWLGAHEDAATGGCRGRGPEEAEGGRVTLLPERLLVSAEALTGCRLSCSASLPAAIAGVSSPLRSPGVEAA